MPQGAHSPQQGTGPTGIPFDRSFFEKVLPESAKAFCAQAGCESAIVELLTVDGQTHYINGISGVADSWVALHTAHADHDHPVQVFIPYQTIFRVEIHPAEDHTRHRLGFVLPGGNIAEVPATSVPNAQTGERAAAQKEA
jgi:hypothetical protein